MKAKKDSETEEGGATARDRGSAKSASVILRGY